MSIFNKNFKIMFMGTPDFSVPVLKALIETTTVVAVVTQPDKKVGRKQTLTQSSVKQLALANKLKVVQPEKIKGNVEFIKQVEKLQPDLIVVVAYGFILPQEVLDIPKFGVINIHASLLPKYRGASPIQAVILNGESKTGVTIMLIDKQMDHGPILAQKQIALTKDENFQSLHDKLAQLGAELLLETLPQYISGQIKPIAQIEAEATYCQLITKEDGHIDWSKAAMEIERQVRAFNPWPSSFTRWDNKVLKILKVRLLDVNEVDGVGKVIAKDNGLAIICGQGALEVLELQLEGKKPMSAKEFLNGYAKLVGAILK